MHGPRWHGAAETKELSSDSPDGKDAGELGEVRAGCHPQLEAVWRVGKKIHQGKKNPPSWCFFLKQPGMVVITRNLVTLRFPPGCFVAEGGGSCGLCTFHTFCGWEWCWGPIFHSALRSLRCVRFFTSTCKNASFTTTNTFFSPGIWS